MMKKKIIKIICLILVIFLNIEPCFAVTASFKGTIKQPVGGGGGGAPDNTKTETYDPGTGNKVYSYSYERIMSTRTDIIINAYNLEGESIIPNSVKVDEKYKLKAGTWVGVSLIEEHTTSWSATNFQY